MDAPRGHQCAKVPASRCRLKEAPIDQATISGPDIAKHVFYACGADAGGHVPFRKCLTQAKLLGFFAAQAPRVVAMEDLCRVALLDAGAW